MITSNKRVLVVEADAAVRDSSAAAIERLGYRAYSTAYIDDFETIMNHLSPAVLILDLNMLARGGADLLNFLVDTRSQCKVLLLCTARQRVAKAARVLAASIGLESVYVLKKPSNHLDLQRFIQQRLSLMLDDVVAEAMPAYRRSSLFGGHFSAGH